MQTDEFFAEAKNLISTGKAVRRVGVFVESGAWLVEFLVFFWDGGGRVWWGGMGREMCICLSDAGWVGGCP